MTYSSISPTASPSWIDCFATDDGRIVVVGGNFQLLVYNIGTKTWGDTTTPASSIKYGPLVQSSMFLNPVYIQSRILADGYTALVVCTLTWNSQPQPYYLDTNTWTVTLAIGTSQTTPPVSPGSSSGWGVIPGGGPLLPPAGFRHYTLAILGQDKNQPKKNYGNGQAFIIGGYSTLVTGQVSDWSALTSFPVQQDPSKSVVMFGNAGNLAKITRGAVAYPVSLSVLDIFPGNGGGSATGQNVEVYDSNRQSVNLLSGLTGGPRNTIFRGATVIGQGSQIFVHGGLINLDFGPSTPITSVLDQSVGIWNGDTEQWGDTANIFVPKKSKALMIGLIAGGAALLLILGGVGFWFFKRKQRLRRLEEEELRAKGLVLKNEDKLQQEIREQRKSNNNYGNNNNDPNNHPGAHGAIAAVYPNQYVSAEEPMVFRPSKQMTQTFPEGVSVQGYNTYIEAELIDDDTPVVHHSNSPQEYSDGLSLGELSRGPTQYQSVVSSHGFPVYGASHGQTPGQVAETPRISEDRVNLENLRTSHDGITSRASVDQLFSQTGQSPLPSSADIRSSLYSQAVSSNRPAVVTGRESYSSIRPYSDSSSVSINPTGTNQFNPYMPSPAFSAAYSLPDSTQGSDAAYYTNRSNPSAGDLRDQNAQVYSYTSQSTVSNDAIANAPPRNTGNGPNSPPVVSYHTRPQFNS
ncbi:hypothetical protein BGZ76_005326 [Entomortierella beljakovae]|nr:hypothetical protein BGZ76_005326 [Entomortierella beljakovae]